MKKLSVLFFIPLVLFLTFTNYYVDPANIFHDESVGISTSILNGNTVYIDNGNLNERLVKYNLIKNMPDEVDCVAVGSSLVMQVNRETVGTESFYNLGMSGADYYDILAEFGMLEVYDKKVNKVIIAVEPLFFDAAYYDHTTVHMDIVDYAYYMMGILNGEEPQIPDEIIATSVQKQIEQLFSVSYFQASINQVTERGSFFNAEKRWGVVEDISQRETNQSYNSDASWNYSLEYEGRGVEYVKQCCDEFWLPTWATSREMSVESMEMFEKLIQHLQSEDVEVVLFLCPIPPYLQERVENEIGNDSMLFRLEEYTKEVAEKYGLEIVGSYNPYNVGISNEDFLDARHIRTEKLTEYFDFK